MSFGKLTLLSADCFGSGAMVGSSRMVADSSGAWGAPGAAGLAGMVCVLVEVLAGVLVATALGATAARCSVDGVGAVAAAA